GWPRGGGGFPATGPRSWCDERPRGEHQVGERRWSPVSELLAVGVSHKTAAVALRERLALPDARAEALLRELVGHPEISEAVALSTCNRTELYVVVGDPVEAESLLLGRLARLGGIRP